MANYEDVKVAIESVQTIYCTDKDRGPLEDVCKEICLKWQAVEV